MPGDYERASGRNLGSPDRKAARSLIVLSATALAVLVVSDLAVTHARTPSTAPAATETRPRASSPSAATSVTSMGATANIYESKPAGSSSEPTPFRPD